MSPGPARAIQVLCILFSLVLFSCNKPGEEVKHTDTAPQAFSVSVTDTSFSGATLHWTNAIDPEGKAVVYSVELNNQTVASDIQNNTYVLTNLQKNTVYSGKVAAADPAGNKTSAAFSFTTGDAPLDLTFKVDSTSNKAVYLSWTSGTIAAGTAVYDIYANNVVRASSLSTSSCTISSLLPQTQYEFKIVARANAGYVLGEKTVSAKTKDNSAPSAFTISRDKLGFSSVTIACSGSQDPDKDELQWFAVFGGFYERPLGSLPNSSTAFSYLLKLLPNSTYDMTLKAKDPFGAETISNTISFTTYKEPQRPVISAREEGGFIVVEWISDVPDQPDAANSFYYINGFQRGDFRSKLSSQVQADNSVLMKLKLDPALFEDNVEKTISIQINWGENNNNLITTSNTIKFTRYVYTSTTAQVSSVVIKGPGTYPPQWSIHFKNCVISDYADWDVLDVRFDTISISNFASFGLCDPMKPGYYTGNVTAEQYNYLKTKNTGYIIIKDAGGLHKLDFTYTTQD